MGKLLETPISLRGRTQRIGYRGGGAESRMSSCLVICRRDTDMTACMVPYRKCIPKHAVEVNTQSFTCKKAPHTFLKRTWPCDGRWERPMAAVGSRGAHAELVCASRFNLWLCCRMRYFVGPHRSRHPNGHPVGSVQLIVRALSPSSLMLSLHARVVPTVILTSPVSGCPTCVVSGLN